jgi:hypothetical protein
MTNNNHDNSLLRRSLRATCQSAESSVSLSPESNPNLLNNMNPYSVSGAAYCSLFAGLKSRFTPASKPVRRSPPSGPTTRITQQESNDMFLDNVADGMVLRYTMAECEALRRIHPKAYKMAKLLDTWSYHTDLIEITLDIPVIRYSVGSPEVAATVLRRLHQHGFIQIESPLDQEWVIVDTRRGPLVPTAWGHGAPPIGASNPGSEGPDHGR